MAYVQLRTTFRPAKPMLTIDRKHRGRLNIHAMKLFPAEATHVCLYWDQQRKRIGIRPCNGDATYGRVIGRVEGGAGVIGLSGLFKTFGLPWDKTRAMPVHVEDSGPPGDPPLYVRIEEAVAVTSPVKRPKA